MNSLHAQAFTDTHFLEAVKGEKDAESKCFTCHAPEALRAKGIGQMPGFRLDVRESGVDCVVCHTDLKGKVHAAFKSGDASHDVEVDPQHKTETLCASCHSAFGTVEEFKQSKSAKEGKTCATCHMPKVLGVSAIGGKQRPIASHSWKGGSDMELLKKSVRLEASVAPGGAITAKVTNHGAGHKFPTGSEFHQALVQVVVLDAAGKQVFAGQELFADQTKSGGKDTRLLPEETRTITVATGQSQGTFRVRLLYQRAPNVADEAATIVGSTEVRL